MPDKSRCRLTFARSRGFLAQVVQSHENHKTSIHKILNLNLWMHAFLAVGCIVVLFAFPVPPFAQGFSSVFKWLLGLGGILIFGISDGHSSSGMKLLGAIILTILVFVLLISLLLNLSLLARLLVKSEKSWLFRIYFLWGITCVLAASFFVGWILNCEQNIYSAITAGDVPAYERAARWRRQGSVNDDLYLAARLGELSMVEYLISRGADPNAKLGGDGDTILSGAIPNVMKIPNGNTPVIDYLKSRGATN